MFLVDTLVLDTVSDLKAKLLKKIFLGSFRFITLVNEW